MIIKHSLHIPAAILLLAALSLLGCDAPTEDTPTEASTEYRYSTLAQELVAPNGQAGDFFGWSVGLSGDYAIVGATREDNQTRTSGAPYVFQRTSGNGWDGGTELVAPNGEAEDIFGQSVALSGDYAIVGAPGVDSQGSGAGAAYVFQRTGGNSWDAGTKLVAPDGEAEDIFGLSVALSGDYAIVAAQDEDSQGSQAGAAYVFQSTGGNSWDGGTKLVAPDGKRRHFFGASVALSGDYAIVGATREDSLGSDAGAAYVFQRTGGNSWDTGTKLVAPNGQAGDFFGQSVALSGDYAIVGAIGNDSQGSGAGAAYIFE